NSMKIKEQTRQLAAGCSKHWFEVADRAVVFTIQHKIHMFITLRRICLRACVVEKEQSYLKFLFFQKRPVSFLHVKSVLAGI
ncbi:hypothetical protein, partial [Streptococcus pneumoniae]|uniref:hypothetical protein n=1 Tax=Streptococcus pneumoniae TaxID=1313 RepID=UPI001156B1F4